MEQSQYSDDQLIIEIGDTPILEFIQDIVAVMEESERELVLAVNKFFLERIIKELTPQQES